ncbi:hypothetical protein ABPG75_013118 [Micractinium tetrahymenae]
MADPPGGRSLAAALEEAGCSASASEAALAAVLQPFGAPSEAALAAVLGMAARTSEGKLSGDTAGLGPGGLKSAAIGDGASTWNVAVLVAGLQAANPRLDWQRVAAALDCPGFAVPDAGALKLLMAAWARAAGGEPFPLPALVGSLWSNAAGQLSFLRQATAAPPELFSWAHAARRQEPLEGLHAGKLPVGTPNQAWLCLDLYDALARLADSGHAPAVRQVLELPLKQCPEVLLLGMATVQPGWGPLQQEVLEPLAVTYVASHPNSGVVLQRLWPLNRDLLLRAMAALYQKDASNIARVLDVCQELKGLTVVLDAAAAPFCLELAALAARREYLNLEKWLSDQFTAKGSGFMQSAVAFLDSKLRNEQPALQTAATAIGPLPGIAGGGRISLSESTLEVFLRVLAANAGLLPSDTLQLFKMVQAAAVQAHPQLAGVAGDSSTLEAFAPDIEEEANAYFQRVYAGEITVEALVEVLKGFKNSTLGREHEVFACMVHNLFDEYRFFPKYPDKELHTTALLFGQLIHHSLVSSISLGIALRYVLEALRTPGGHQSKMARFGATALKQFAGDLAQWPQYCQHLAQVPGLKEAEPELYKSLEVALATIAANGAAATAAAESAAAAKAAADAAPLAPRSREGNAAGFPTSMPSSGPSNPNMLFSTINAETLEMSAQDVSFPVPEDKTIDRVHFIINNITSMNIEQKVKELKSYVAQEYWPWFANYLVVKRAAQEPNFHNTYVLLVDKWGERKMRDTLVSTTVHYIKVMLRSSKLKSITSERTLLKNLGAWLGKLTLANNRPVLQKHLDVKATILEAYEQGKMLAVLSFVRMLLEPAMDSRVFRPPNPWVMAILALLVEVYNLDNIKTGLKFEVELLFKSMNMQLQDVAPSNLLAGRRRESLDNIDFQAQRPTSQGGMAAGPGAAAPVGTPSKAEPAAAAAAAAEGKPAPPAPGPMIDPNIIANLHNYIIINPQLAIVGERLQLKRLVPMAVDRAIVEIISPVVDRSVTIACMTTQELVLKDHALEPDADALRKSAHLMVTGLAQSLALVTAKEPLRIAVANNLRALLSNQLDANTLEQVVAMLVADNLDLCCQVIEKAAGERAQREIDERLQGAYAARVRAKAAGQPFADTALLGGRFPGALPEALRPRPGQLTPQQQRVYEDFARIPRTAAAAQQSAGQPRPAGGLGQGEGGEAGVPPAGVPPGAGLPGPGPAGPGGEVDQQAAAAAASAAGLAPPQPQPDLRSRFISWLQRMDLAIAKDPQAPLASLSDGSEVKVLVSEIAAIPTNEATALEVAKNIFAKVYQGTSSRLHVTAYCASLEVLKETAVRRLPVELTAWFAQLPEEGKFHKDVGEALLRGGLLYLPDLDLYLAKVLAGPRYQLAAEFALHLVQQCCIVDPVVAAPDLAHTLDVLAKLATRVSGGNAVLQLVEEARRISLLRAGKQVPAAAPPPLPEGPKDPPQLVETIMKLFDRWARLLEEAPQEKVHAPFVQELQQAGFLKGDDMTERFLRIMIQLAVQHCLRSEAAAAANLPPGAPRPTALSFIAIDAAVRLFVCLITQHGGGPALLTKVLGILATVLQRDADERGGAFNGRPYFRLCIGFLAELSPADPATDEVGLQYLQAMAAFLYATRALKAPAFAFPWLQLASDRRLMPRLLGAPAHRGWGAYLQLILVQLRFLEPFLRNAELTDAVRLLYKGTLRVLLLLLHDFPEFLCEFHFHLCDVIPPSCIQMRNLVLSAFPRAMRLPDPFTPNLKVDLLPEIAAPPHFVPAPEQLLPAPLRAEVDAFLGGAGPPGFLLGLRSRLALSPADALACGTRYNAPLVNALAFYLGIRAVEAAPPKPGTSPAMATLHMEVLQHLLRDLDTEGRYLLINALANHLRFPNAHTHYFSCAILFLFTEAGSELIQEQITRVLLERLIVNRPHPWGLLITFIELIKNPRYSFWSHAFTRVAPEIERLFESVARSCMGPQVAAAAAGGAPGAGGKDEVPQAAAPALA